ncbi:hypothetical protein D9M69_507690 [compost metagenome]
MFRRQALQLPEPAPHGLLANEPIKVPGMALEARGAVPLFRVIVYPGRDLADSAIRVRDSFRVVTQSLFAASDLSSGHPFQQIHLPGCPGPVSDRREQRPHTGRDR